MKKVGLIVIGNEVLNGSTLDTNSHFMCQYVEAHGSKVKKISTIPDETNTIINEINSMINYVDIIITFGGLGPTIDDLTIDAVSKSIGKSMKKNELALKYINDRYSSLAQKGIVEKHPSTKALQSREKMAYLPENTIPLWNPIGAAPAAIIPHNGKHIICFPGVPREITAICAKYDKEIFEKILGKGSLVSYRIITSTNDESEMATSVEAVSKQFKEIYIKTRPVFGSDKQEIGITVTGTSENEREILNTINNAIYSLKENLLLNGISIVSETRII